MTEKVQLSATVSDDLIGKRLDLAVAELFPEYSRSRLQSWIKDGQLTVDGEVKRPRDKLLGGELLAIAAELDIIDQYKAVEIIRVTFP